MAANLYFAYGANMSREGMSRRCPGASIIGVATLRDYRFLITDRGGASVSDSPGSIVFGILWQVTDRHLEALDEYEGVPEWYRRERREVLFEGEPCTAEIYLATSGRVGRPWPGYLEKIVRAAREMGMPETYVEDVMGRVSVLRSLGRSATSGHHELMNRRNSMAPTVEQLF